MTTEHGELFMGLARKNGRTRPTLYNDLPPTPENEVNQEDWVELLDQIGVEMGQVVNVWLESLEGAGGRNLQDQEHFNGLTMTCSRCGQINEMVEDISDKMAAASFTGETPHDFYMIGPCCVSDLREFLEGKQ